jgi:hypothetical protein
LSTIAGIGGVIIGLFYASVVSLGTSVYAKLPSDAKSLLHREPLGNLFIRFLSYLTFFCVILIFLQFFGFEKSTLALQFILIMTGVSIFGMVKLGDRLFYLTDPTLLANASFRILIDMFKMSKVGVFNWDNIHFQTHYKKTADTSIRTLHVLTDIAITEKHLSGESLLQLSNDSLRTLRRYIGMKKSIPGGSYWFSVKYKHKKWYEISDLSLSSHDIAGYVQPEEIKDNLWIERELIKIAVSCFEINLKNKNFDILDNCLLNIEKTIRALIANFELMYAYEVYNKLEHLIFDNSNYSEISDEELLRFLNLIDLLGLLRINIILGEVKNLEKYNLAFIQEELSKIDWNHEKTLYSTKLPYFTHDRLKFLYDRINYEIKVEQKRITPDWFIKNLIVQVFVERYKDNLIFIISKSETHLEKYKNDETHMKLISHRAGVFIHSALMDRLLEQTKKLSVLFDYFDPVWKELDSVNKLTEMKWPKLDLEAEWKRCQNWENEVLDEISKTCYLISSYENDGSFPDYSGKFLHHIGNSIVLNIINNKAITNKTFSAFFYCSLSMFDKLKEYDPDEPQWLINNRHQIAIAPILDLIAISGYIFLSSEYSSEHSSWQNVKAIWDKYLEKDKEKRLKLLMEICNLPNQQFGTLPHRSVYRTSWSQTINNFFRDELNIQNEWYQHHGAFGYNKKYIVSHSSNFLKTFVKGNMKYSSFDGEDVFIDVYLSKVLPDLELSFSFKQGNFNRDVEYEVKNGNGDTRDD